MTVDILGTKYTVYLDVDEKDDAHLKEADGYMDHSVKRIVVAKIESDEQSLADLRMHAKKVLRHEIIHAFLAESGLGENSGEAGSWARNEEMVDWIAIQFPKILKAFQQCECM